MAFLESNNVIFCPYQTFAPLPVTKNCDFCLHRSMCRDKMNGNRALNVKYPLPSRQFLKWAITTQISCNKRVRALAD